MQPKNMSADDHTQRIEVNDADCFLNALVGECKPGRQPMSGCQRHRRQQVVNRNPTSGANVKMAVAIYLSLRFWSV
jgi:hypothetical protein